MSLPAIRYIASTTSSKLAHIYLQCHIRPNSRSPRSGITAINDHAISIAISAPPHDGEANKAVALLISNALKCPKSDVDIVKGLKSREKTVSVAVAGLGNGNKKAVVERVREELERAMV